MRVTDLTHSDHPEMLREYLVQSEPSASVKDVVQSVPVKMFEAYSEDLPDWICTSKHAYVRKSLPSETRWLVICRYQRTRTGG